MVFFPKKYKFAFLKICCLGGMALGAPWKAFTQKADNRSHADSLQVLAASAPSDSVRIERLFELSHFWSDRDTARAFAYIREAKKRMPYPPTPYHQALIQHFSGNIIFLHNPEKAKALYLKADAFLKKETTRQAFVIRSKAWNNYGVLLQMQDSAGKYMDIIVNKSLPYARKSGDSAVAGSYLHNIGLLLMNIQEYEKAETYFKQAAATLSHQKNTEEAQLETFVNSAKNALFMKNPEAARAYLAEAARELAQVPHSTFAPMFFRTEGSYYRSIQQLPKAIQSFEKARQRATDLNDHYMLQDIHFEMYATYRDAKQFSKAASYLDSTEIYTPLNKKHDQLLLMRERALIAYRTGHYKEAYAAMETYALLKDSSQQENMALKMLDLEKKYQSVEKENEILRLREENVRKQKAIAENRWWIIGLGAILLLSLAIIYLSWSLFRRNKKLLAQKEMLHKEELLSVQQRERMKQYESVLEGQELERNRLARDLHDGLGGMLAGVKLKLSSLHSKNKGTTEDIHSDLPDVERKLDQAVQELRKIARNMLPEALLSMGLEAALSDLCRYLNSADTAIRFHAFDLEKNRPPALLIAVYRITQELLTNALKHAGANNIIVQCSQMEQILFLTVEDDGKGMDTTKQSQNGFGLTSIKNRVALLNARMEINSKKGEGTTVNIQIPL